MLDRLMPGKDHEQDAIVIGMPLFRKASRQKENSQPHPTSVLLFEAYIRSIVQIIPWERCVSGILEPAEQPVMRM